MLVSPNRLQQIANSNGDGANAVATKASANAYSRPKRARTNTELFISIALQALLSLCNMRREYDQRIQYINRHFHQILEIAFRSHKYVCIACTKRTKKKNGCAAQSQHRTNGAHCICMPLPRRKEG